MSRRSGPPCPSCGSDLTVNITHRGRPRRIGDALWRGHECRSCKHKFVTIERAATPDEITRAS